MSSSVEQVRHYLKLQAKGLRPEDAGESVAAHVAELRRRVARLRRAGVSTEVRVSAAVEALIASSAPCQEVWG